MGSAAVRIQSGLLPSQLCLVVFVPFTDFRVRIALQPGICITESLRQKIKKNGGKDAGWSRGSGMESVCVFWGFCSPYQANITFDFAALTCSHLSEKEL